MSAAQASPSQETPTATAAIGRVALIEHFLACLQDDPGDAIASLVHADFRQFDLPDPRNPDGRSAMQLVEDWRSSASVLQWQRIHVASVVEVGDSVVAHVRWEGMTRAGANGHPAAVPLSSELGIVFGFRDGKIVSQRNYDWRRFLASFSRMGDWSTA